jgi:hypothetical protein
VHAEVLALVHWTQRPASRPEVAQAGVGARQSAARAGSHGRHIRVARSQTGAAPPQSASLAQPTQRLVVGSHTPVRQSLLETHWTQRPALAPAAAQARAPGSVQSAEALQGRQVRVVASHTGRAGSAQSRLEAQATQVLLATSQSGVGARQWLAEVQGTQRPALGPEAAQAGRVGSIAAHWASDEHTTQTRVARSQTGVAALRTQSRSALQRHTPAARSQTGAVAGQLRSGEPGTAGLVRPAAVSRASGRQSLSESVSR